MTSTRVRKCIARPVLGVRTFSALALISGLIGSFAAAGCAAAAEPSGRFETATSPSGIVFHYQTLPKAPTATLLIGWRDGVATMSPGKEGLSTLGPDMLTSGTREQSEGEFKETLQDLHMSGGFSVNQTYTLETITAPAEKLTEAARLMARAITEPALSPKLLARLKQRYSTEARTREIQPQTVATRAGLQLLLGPAAARIAVPPAAFEAVTREDIDAWRERVFARDGATVVAAGPLDAAAFGLAIDAAFEGVKPHGTPAEIRWPDVQPVSKTVLIEQPTAQTIIIMMGPASIPVGRPALIARIADMILGGGSDSRLFVELRRGLGATYGASSGLMTYGAGRRLALMQAPVAHGKAADAIEAMRRTYAKWLQDGITEDEFARARSSLLNQVQQRRANASNAAADLLDYLEAGLSVQDYESLPGFLGGLDRAAVTAAQQTAFPQPPLLTIILAPKGSSLPADCVIEQLAEIDRCRL